MAMAPGRDRVEERVEFDADLFPTVVGEHDHNLNLIERTFGVRLVTSGSSVLVRGDEVAARRVAELLRDLATSPELCAARGELEVVLERLTAEPAAHLHDLVVHGVAVGSRRIVPKSAGQVHYLDAIRDHDMVFAIGPAGTGKTYLAMAAAIHALKAKEVERIILARPAVEAGESLGFLPGDLQEKVNPYLRPLYDALYDMVHHERAEQMIEHGAIEIAPLAFMRGRTLNDAFIILDEAQNCTSDQMKMFLTRMGFSSKVVVTGDVTQTDLPSGQPSGLAEAQVVMDGVEGVAFVHLAERDVVRHPLVRRVIAAYARYEARKSR
ncbi:MAG: PhoH family protein [Deltaproteobacteria bacterium]|nr:PhoH family protein [Deltaproteobacteria bacterium]NCP96298.1 PhoH family protein [Deltaproteobacteria bacterium]NCS73893.1 PhoH family protein [Deltaproteobacteria bacterium]